MPAWYEPIVETGLVPDRILRTAIRQQVGAPRPPQQSPAEAGDPELSTPTCALRRATQRPAPSPSIRPTPTASTTKSRSMFFLRVLGTHRKYSCCYWEDRRHARFRASAACSTSPPGAPASKTARPSSTSAAAGAPFRSTRPKIPEQLRPGRLELPFTARIHRSRSAPARSRESARRHCRHQLVQPRPALRPHRLGRNDGARPQL